MSDTDFKVQWSVSLPPAAQYAKGDMLNLRGDSVEEVEALFDEILDKKGEFADKAAQVGAFIRTAATVHDVRQDGNEYQGQKEESGPPANSTTPRCKHGLMEYKAPFESRAGKKMSASWNCPLGYKDRDSCKTEWVND